MDSLFLVVEAKKEWPDDSVAKSFAKLVVCSRKGWLLERILLCLLFSPMDFYFASLLLILIMWYIRLDFRRCLKLAETELITPALPYLKFFVGLLGS